MHYKHWHGGSYVLGSGISQMSKRKHSHLVFLWVTLVFHTLFLEGTAVRAEHPPVMQVLVLVPSWCPGLFCRTSSLPAPERPLHPSIPQTHFCFPHHFNCSLKPLSSPAPPLSRASFGEVQPLKKEKGCSKARWAKVLCNSLLGSGGDLLIALPKITGSQNGLACQKP